jgi:secondary thiamine-phosphate synthase enzyme
MLFQISLTTSSFNQIIDITGQVQELIPEWFSGMVMVYVPHTTCWITINEWYDPDVWRDLLYWLSKLVPKTKEFKHIEGNSDAHIKSSLIGISQNIIVENWKMILWRWQRILFCEFDGPRRRKVWVKLQEDR